MQEPGQLSMEEIKERLDFLEARVNENEGDTTLSSIYWDELRHLRQVYDRMVMDSHGKGMPMLQDIMDKSPETRENYVSGVPVASSAAPDMPHVETEKHAESAGESPAVNLTINVNGGSAMEPKINESLMRSQGDVRIPLDMQVRLEKARKAHKADCKENLEGIDQDKVEAADKKKEKPGEKTEPEESKDSDDMAEIKRHEQGIEHEVKEIADRKAEKSFYRAETETLEKSLLSRQARKNTVASAAGYWLHKRLKKACDVDPLARVVRETLEKSAGASLVMGIPASGAEAKKSAYAQIVALNCEIQRMQEKLQECNEPDEQVECNKKLRAAYEKLALAVMQSEGLGLKTEDMVVDKPDTRFSPEMTRPVIGVASKSQKDDLAKSGKHFTGKLADGSKYAVTVWGKDGVSEADKDAAIEKSVGGEDVKLIIEG